MQIDNQEMMRLRGGAGWVQSSAILGLRPFYYVAAGSHALRWTYQANVLPASIAAVDEVTFTPVIPSDNMSQLYYPQTGVDGFGTGTNIAVIQASDGNFYGTNSSQFFRMTPNGEFSALAALSDCRGGVIQGRDGDFYGITFGGMIFRATAAGVVTSLRNLSQGEGASAECRLVEDAAGTIYGTATFGGSNGKGTIFKRTVAGAFAKLHDFTGPDGDTARGGLAFGTDGNLYGVTEKGGVNNNGAVFKITPEGAFAILHSFAAGGGHPSGALTLGPDGSFYGTTTGGSGKTAVFSVTPGGQMTIRHPFTAEEGSDPPGLTLHSDGNLYGVTRPFGAIIYRITTAGDFRVMHIFSNQEDGYAPASAPLASATDGSLYGFTTDIGGNGAGVFYRINPSLDGYALWRAANWPAGTADEIAGLLADPDLDGLANIVEYAMDSDPNVVSALPRPQIQPWEEETMWFFTFVRPVGRSDVVLRGEMSVDLLTWTSSPPGVQMMTQNLGNGTERIFIGTPYTGRVRYLRIEATK